ncbi:DUF3905 domain-containing protein [Neobacillus notoginsengisoli]|uniref:DUF3905 domain-containing protein n=1 Tax=Neobacillus notoginsengisoli TaxID=1578198 RepID=A0A417YFC8_9BACI|nr:DUF3905 domain-containing protein [Neobacillus notoginsengisoli]RHW31431.1 DUF3905 domain-containing protein [Neobacillus notoginsengisoli]
MDGKQKELKRLEVDGTLPHQINAPDFKETGIEIEAPFM